MQQLIDLIQYASIKAKQIKLHVLLPEINIIIKKRIKLCVLPSEIKIEKKKK